MLPVKTLWLPINVQHREDDTVKLAVLEHKAQHIMCKPPTQVDKNKISSSCRGRVSISRKLTIYGCKYATTSKRFVGHRCPQMPCSPWATAASAVTLHHSGGGGGGCRLRVKWETAGNGQTRGHLMVKPARRIARLRWLQQTVKVVPSDFVSQELGSAHVSPRPSVQNEQQLKKWNV